VTSGRGHFVLAIDGGSPVSSVALARADDVLAEAALERAAGSAESLLALVDQVLERAGVEAAELGDVCALRGPGSFTGLRIGLATALGLHQALGLRATAMPTLHVLAAAAAVDHAVAVVDARRGEWFAQSFHRRRDEVEAAGVPALVAARALRVEPGSVLVGFGVAALAAALGLPPGRAIEPPALAAVAARLAARWSGWDAGLLTDPLYLRSAPVTPQPARGLPRSTAS
jgi:tRNA threonylcarbamoyladenosine biosynthesis protein TsaB